MSNTSQEKRKGCGDSSAQSEIWFGGCNPSYLEQNTSSYQLYKNATQVAAISEGTASIDPYPRISTDATILYCSAYSGYTCGDGTNGHFYCNIPKPYEVDIVPTGSSVSSGLYSNSFLPNGTSSINSCSPVAAMGFKNVYAKRKWQGRYGYLSPRHPTPDSIDWCCKCLVKNEVTQSDTVKYLALNGSATYSNRTTYTPEGEDPYDITFTSWASAETVMDKFGAITTASCASGSNDIEQEWLIGESTGLLSMGNDTSYDVYTTYCNTMASLVTYGPGIPYSIVGGGNNYTCSFGLTDGNPSEVVMVNLPNQFAWDSYSYRIPIGGGTPVWIQSGHVELNLESNTYLSYQDWSFGETIVQNNYTEHNYSCTLSSPNYVYNVVQELKAFLSASIWDLGDDDSYPFRTDTDVTMGPLVSYNENFGSTVPTIPLCDFPPFNYYSGDIMGKPLPLGYDKFWNPLHENWRICTDERDDCKYKYIESYGAWSTDCNVPRATQWTNYNDRTQIPQGAFSGANFFWSTPSTCTTTGEGVIHDDILWAGKYAEIIQEKQSFNYCRPCGIDRLIVSESTNRCILSASYSSSNVLSLDTNQPATNLITGDKCIVYGTDIDGIYTVTTLGDYSIELSTQLASGSQFPSYPYESGTGFIGKLKYITSSGICGRVNIVTVSSGSILTASLLEPQWLMAGDTVNITGSLGMTSLNGTWTVSGVLDSQHVVLSGSFLSQSSYISSSAMMYGSGSVDWKWNDVAPKGDYVTKEWTNEYRDVGEYNRLLIQSSSIGMDCTEGDATPCSAPTVPSIPRPYQEPCGLYQTVTSISCSMTCSLATPCSPYVVFYSPWEEVKLKAKYANQGYTLPLVTIDDTYPTMWNGLIQQYDNDYVSQAPPCKCNAVETEGEDTKYYCSCQWVEDSGVCFPDSGGTPCVQRYAGLPQVEARCSPPEGFDSGSYLWNKVGCAMITDFISGSCPSKPVCNPPRNDGHYVYSDFVATLTFRPYWDIYIAKEGCVCSHGRFMDAYNAQGIFCSEEELI